MTDSHKYEFDKLALYFGEPYYIPYEGGQIEVLQPMIGDILACGEKKFYSALHVFTQNTTSCRLQLWDMGKDWNKMSDYELFCMLIPTLNLDATSLLFGSLDFQAFVPTNIKVGDTEATTLYDPKTRIEINEETYQHIAQYIRTMFNIFPKTEKTKGKTMKEWLIEEEREKLRLHKDDEPQSTLLPLISAYVNHPGTKYKKNELRDVGIYEFMDSIQRLQIYESTVALMHGMYSGMVNAKEIDPEAFNFMRTK